MKLAFLVPVDNMKLTEKGDILYILAHLLKNKKYYNYCKNSKQYKIIDNSVHEGAEIGFRKYMQYAKELNVDEIILQDVLDNYSETMRFKDFQLKEYYEQFKENNFKIMAVVQGENMAEFDRAFVNYLKDERVDVIGVSFSMVVKTYTKDKYRNYFLNRQLLVKRMAYLFAKHRLPFKPVHLLGSSSWIEPIMYKKYPFIRSNDTKLLSRLSKSRIKLPSMIIGKPLQSVTLTEKFNRYTREMLRDNIDYLKDMLAKN